VFASINRSPWRESRLGSLLSICALVGEFRLRSVMSAIVNREGQTEDLVLSRLVTSGARWDDEDELVAAGSSLAQFS